MKIKDFIHKEAIKMAWNDAEKEIMSMIHDDVKETRSKVNDLDKSLSGLKTDVGDIQTDVAVIQTKMKIEKGKPEDKKDWPIGKVIAFIVAITALLGAVYKFII